MSSSSSKRGLKHVRRCRQTLTTVSFLWNSNSVLAFYWCVTLLTCVVSAFMKRGSAAPHYSPRTAIERSKKQQQLRHNHVWDPCLDGKPPGCIADSSKTSSLLSATKHDNDKNDDIDVLRSSSTKNETNLTLESPSTKNDAIVDRSRQNRRIQIALGLIASITVMAVLAKIGILPGPIVVSDTTGQHQQFGVYTDTMIVRDSISTALAAVLAVILVKTITYGYENKWYNSKVGRKLNHTLAAPLFIAFFPAFSQAEGARFFAGLVTFSNILRLYLAGTGKGESTLAQTISRSGDKKEVLGGPFIYVCLFQLFIWFFWRNSFIGVIAMSTMAAGDGMADLVGRKWGANNKWTWSDGNKSIVGTVAFVLSAFVVSFALVSWLIATGCLQTTMTSTDLASRVFLISFVTAFVELFPFGDDNYTVPGCAAIMAAILLR